jgi:aspartyl-tRNA synthetase
MERTWIIDTPEKVEEEVLLKGWVHVRRDMGKMVFIDLRDRTAICQVVFLPHHEEALAEAAKLRPEFVVAIRGRVNARPEKQIKEDEATGTVEIEALELEILNEAKTPPFEIDKGTENVDEEIRMKYRYLDMRTERMQKNLKLRDNIITFFREYMHKDGFTEIETPILMKDTPEGSREYLVPSRKDTGKFYALPQSPQQFKQLTMVGGLERYFQIARCFRDEDMRGDRQPEFTQLDFEMSFVTQEDVLKYTEAMFIELVKAVAPEKKISVEPFPRLTYAESMEKYGNDKPDLRKDKNDPNELAFAWVLDFPMFEKMSDGSVQAMHHPFCSVKPEDEDKLDNPDELFNIRANAYDLVLNGYELSSGSIRIHKADMQAKIFELLGISEEEQQEKFGHMFEAFSYGAPPHGGFAPGIDRIAMILAGEKSIREVIAFPKTNEARDLMMGAPSKTSQKNLDELNINITS